MKKTGLIAALLLSLLGGGVFLGISDDESDHASSEHLANQLWIARWPSDRRDIVPKLIALETDGQRFGIAGKSSVWTHEYDVFLWSQKRDQLRMVFPQEQQRVAFKTRTWECKGEAPEPFELCLELSRGERNFRLYSMVDWDVRQSQVEADVARIQQDESWLGDLRMSIPTAIPHGVDEMPFSEVADAKPSWSLFQ